MVQVMPSTRRVHTVGQHAKHAEAWQQAWKWNPVRMASIGKMVKCRHPRYPKCVWRQQNVKHDICSASLERRWLSHADDTPALGCPCAIVPEVPILTAQPSASVAQCGRLPPITASPVVLYVEDRRPVSDGKSYDTKFEKAERGKIVPHEI